MNRMKLAVEVVSSSANVLLRDQKEPIRFKGLKATFETEDPRQDIDLTVQMVFDPSTANGDGASRAGLVSRTRFVHLFNKEGRYDLEGASIQSGTEVKSLPADIIELLIGTEIGLAELLGPTISVKNQGLNLAG